MRSPLERGNRGARAACRTHQGEREERGCQGGHGVTPPATLERRSSADGRSLARLPQPPGRQRSLRRAVGRSSLQPRLKRRRVCGFMHQRAQRAPPREAALQSRQWSPECRESRERQREQQGGGVSALASGSPAREAAGHGRSAGVGRPPLKHAAPPSVRGPPHLDLGLAARGALRLDLVDNIHALQHLRGTGQRYSQQARVQGGRQMGQSRPGGVQAGRSRAPQNTWAPATHSPSARPAASRLDAPGRRRHGGRPARRS